MQLLNRQAPLFKFYFFSSPRQGSARAGHTRHDLLSLRVYCSRLFQRAKTCLRGVTQPSKNLLLLYKQLFYIPQARHGPALHTNHTRTHTQMVCSLIVLSMVCVIQNKGLGIGVLILELSSKRHLRSELVPVSLRVQV